MYDWFFNYGKRDAVKNRHPLFRNVRGEWVPDAGDVECDWEVEKIEAYMAGYDSYVGG